MIVRRVALAAFACALAVGQPAQAAEPDTSCEPKDLAALSGWSGVWGAEGMEGDIAGSVRAAPKFFGLFAPWNDTGWKRMRQLGVLNRANPLRIAAAWGFPTMMSSYSEIKFVVAPAETVIISQYRDIRYVYTDGRGHPPEDELWPNNWGDSTGCWVGDTLTIDTIGAKFDPAFNYLAPPLSEQAHFVERLRLVAPDRIEGEMVITDPETLTGPWTVHFAFVPAGIDRLVHEGDNLLDRNQVEGDQATITPPSGDWTDNAQVPPEVALGPAELDRVAGRYKLDGNPVELAIERRGDRLFTQFSASPFSVPLFADAPLSFSDVDGGTYRFATDAAGQVVGFEGTSSRGEPQKGTRLSPGP